MGIDFGTVEKHLVNHEGVIAWMLGKEVGRSNLNDFLRTELRGGVGRSQPSIHLLSKAGTSDSRPNHCYIALESHERMTRRGPKRQLFPATVMGLFFWGLLSSSRETGFRCRLAAPSAGRYGCAATDRRAQISVAGRHCWTEARIVVRWGNRSRKAASDQEVV